MLSGLGHGTLGLADRLRTFTDLQLDPEADRHPYLELKLGKFLTGWTADASNFKRTTTAAEITYAGVIRAIVGAYSLIAPRPLVQVERLADMVAGTFFYDHDALVAGGSTDVYVRLPTATDPDDSSAGLVIELLFGFSTVNEAHPIFGPEKMTNGDYETFAGGLFTGWTEYNTGGGTGCDVQQETSIVYEGLSAAKITGTALAAGNIGGQYQEKVGVSGALYRVACRYRTDAANDETFVKPWLAVGRAPDWMSSDGRTLSTTEGFAVASTQGEWRSVCFDFRWAGATTTAVRAALFLKNTAGVTKAGTLYVDDFTFRRIYRYERFAAALDAGSIPEVEIRAQSINFAPTTIGIGSIALIDGDGALTRACAGLLSLNRSAMVYVGGAFRNGSEITRDDWWPAFAGTTRKPTFTDGRIQFELDTAHTLTKVQVPPNVHRVADAATMARNQEGQRKPYVFGTPWDTGGATLQHIIPAVRVATDATKGYGDYQYLDPTTPIATGVDVDMPAGYSIKAYPNKDLADRNLQGYEITDSTNDFELVAGTNKCTWRVKRDIRNYRYDRAGNDVGTGSVFTFGIGSFTVSAGVNDKIDVTVGATTATATLTAGRYTGASLATHVEAQLDAIVTLGDFSVSYSATTGKFTITYNAGGNLELLTFTGANAATNACRLLMGFVTPKGEVLDKIGNSVFVDTDSTQSDWLNATHYSSSVPVFGVTVYTCTLDLSGPAYAGAAALQVAMRAAAGGITTIAVTYSETTHKFTIAYSGSELIFSLIMANPVKAYIDGSRVPDSPQKQSYKLFGYDTKTDKTGAATYTGDVATFTEVDADHVLRFNGGGYRDDATGSICGTANVAINTPAAIAAWILRYVLNIPAASIDVPSFAIGRQAGLDDFAIQYRWVDRADVMTTLGELCQIGLFTLNVSGDGKWTCTRYTAGSTGARDLFERDLVGSWKMWLDPDAVYKAVKVHGDWNPSLQRYMTSAGAEGVIDTYIPIKHGDERTLEINGAVERQYITGSTLFVANYYGRLVGKIPRVMEFSSRKIIDRLIGHKLKITRDRAYDTAGTLSALVVRIVGLRHNLTSGVSTCTAVEDVVFLS